MVTTQILQRPFFGKVIRQNHHTTYLCANDIFEVGNAYRKNCGMEKVNMEKYMRNKKTKEFIQAIMRKESVSEPIFTSRGRNALTWVHPFVALDILMWLNPDFKVEAIRIIYDSVCVFRDKSGDSYKELSLAIDKHLKLPPAQTGLAISSIATQIKKHIRVDDWNTATQEQLELRDKIHRDMLLLIEVGIDPYKAIEAVLKRY